MSAAGRGNERRHEIQGIFRKNEGQGEKVDSHMGRTLLILPFSWGNKNTSARKKPGHILRKEPKVGKKNPGMSGERGLRLGESQNRKFKTLRKKKKDTQDLRGGTSKGQAKTGKKPW